MKISKRTIDILKNFSIISNSIFFDEPKIAKTQAVAGNIFAIADIEEEFPTFGVYDLSSFLGVISLFDLEKTEFNFEEKYVNIESGRSSAKYGFTDIDLIANYGRLKKSTYYKNFNKFNASFEIDQDEINKLKKSSSVMSLPNMDIKIKDGKGVLKIFDSEHSLSNNFKTKFEGEGECDTSLNMTNLIIMSNDYTVHILDKSIVKFLNKDKNLLYILSAKR